MWKLTGFDSDVAPSMHPEEVGLTSSAKTTLVEAELYRDPTCSVRHIFPIDIVFSLRNKGPRKRRTLREEDTFEKRHMSELTAPADAAVLQSLMQKQGTHPKQAEYHRYWTIIEQGRYDTDWKTIRQLLPGESDGLIAGTVEIYAQAFEHLMFDSAYFEALRRCARTGTISDSLAGTEKFRVGDTCPIVPGYLTPDLREQWMKDFRALTSYALEKGLGAKDDLPQSLDSKAPTKSFCRNATAICRRSRPTLAKATSRLRLPLTLLRRKPTPNVRRTSSSIRPTRSWRLQTQRWRRG